MSIEQVFVGLGSNLGDSREVLNAALDEIRAFASHLTVSSLYRSSPVSPLPQPDFLNQVCRFKTSLKPLELLAALQAIECKLGKKEKPKDAPRLIDLDILFYGLESQVIPMHIRDHGESHKKFLLIRHCRNHIYIGYIGQDVMPFKRGQRRAEELAIG